VNVHYFINTSVVRQKKIIFIREYTQNNKYVNLSTYFHDLSMLTSTFRKDTLWVEDGLKLGLYLLIGLEMFLCCYFCNCTARAVYI
jgi:hypothetical protein